MFINYRLKAKRQMAIFATLGFAGIALCIMSGLAMATIPHQDFAFWAMMGVGMVGFFTLFWSILGFIFGLIDYKSLSQVTLMDAIIIVLDVLGNAELAVYIVANTVEAAQQIVTEVTQTVSSVEDNSQK